VPPKVFDWRDDPSGTIVALPQVRARFIRREPNAPLGNFHTHEESDGVETWVVLEGAVKFEFEDRAVVATAGQAVVALPHEKHRISCAGDEPAVYFLTVAPHRAPTHTHYDAAGNRLPTRPGELRPKWRGELAMGVEDSSAT
jgi:mannose-6-phosphate isomerase-like protein (cupin superfamily)